MVRILIICRRRTLFATIQASVQSVVFYHASTVREGERIILSSYPDLVCLALSPGESKSENMQNLQKIPGRKNIIPFLFLLEKEFNNQIDIIPDNNIFVLYKNQFNAEKFISSVLLYSIKPGQQLLCTKLQIIQQYYSPKIQENLIVIQKCMLNLSLWEPLQQYTL